MNTIATKRIYRDYKNYYNSNLSDQGIYCIMDEDNMSIMRAMIVGPKDTPYEGGCYYFLFQFPKNYPFSPPKVTIETRDRRIRINPNFYTCGKVCLSILNTWAGEQWTSACSLNAVLLTLQSRFNEYPIINEPGFEKSSKSQKSKDYNKVVAWYNIETAVYDSLMKPPPTFECFYNEARLQFCHFYPKYIKYLTSIYKEDHLVIHSRIYNCKAQYRPYLFASMLTDLYENIYPQYKELIETEKEPETTVENETTIENETTVETEVQSTNNNKPNKNKTGTRRVPKKKATLLDIGTKMKSETTGDMYIVSQRKDGRKMWKKIETN